MRYIDAKITSINGGVEVRWQTDDEAGTWLDAEHYTVAPEILMSPALLKAWLAEIMEAFNAGKDKEESEGHAPSVPADVLEMVNTPLSELE